MFSCSLIVVALAGAPESCRAADATTSVYAPSHDVAVRVLRQSHVLRERVCEQWLGKNSSVSTVPLIVHIAIDEHRSPTGVTSINTGHPEAKGVAAGNIVWIRTNRTDTPEFLAVLQHELCHCVLAAAYPDRLPAWLHEGIASRYDTGRRREIVQQQIRDWSTQARLPLLADILAETRVSPQDTLAYAESVALVQFLLDRGGQKLLWDTALTEQKRTNFLSQALHHENVNALQTDWEHWLRGRTRPVSHQRLADSNRLSFENGVPSRVAPSVRNSARITTTDRLQFRSAQTRLRFATASPRAMQ